jgi:N4-gp56 family major capsid protein
MAAQVTTGLTQEMSTYYEKVFLARAEYEYIHKEGAQVRTQPKNEGKQVNFTRHTPLATVTTALSEGSNPSEVNLTASTVSAALAEYGTTVKISRFLSLTSIDANNKEKIEVVAQNMGETLDEIVRNELFTGATAQLAGSKAALTDISASNTLSAAEIRKAVRTLKANKARKYQGRGSYVCKTGPFPAYDLMGDSTWVNASTYDNGAEAIYKGEIGLLYGVRFLESPAQKTETSTVTVYSNFVHGSDAFGTTDLEGDKPQLFIIPHTNIDSGNTAGRFSTVAWAAAFVAKTLNANWLINVKTGATA